MKKYITIILIFLLIFQNITIQAMDDMFMTEVMLDNSSIPEMNLKFMDTDDGLTLQHTFFQALEGASNASQDSLEAVQSSMNGHSTSSVDMPTAGQDFFTTNEAR